MPNQFLSPEGDLENYFVSEYWVIDQYIGDELLTWGYGFTGALGNASDSSNSSVPITTFAGGTNWKQTSVARDATAAIKTDGTLWIWGDSALGVLGNGFTTGVFSTPITTFAGETNWKQVSLKTYHAAAIKTDGTLWVWGAGSNGKLGNGIITGNRSTPVTTFAGGTNWKQVSAGRQHTAAIKTDGTLWTWGGAYAAGELGNATINGSSTPVTTFAGGTDWKQVSCGYTHTAAIKTDGTLWTWGYSKRLGNATITGNISTPVTTFAGGTDWKQVGAGGSLHMAAIKTDGTLWIWGTTASGSLGNGISSFGITISTPITTFAGGINWKQVSTGGYYTAAIKTDGTLWTWGTGDDGRLGNRVTTGNISTPVTTFAGGTNWKLIDSGYNRIAAVTAGINAYLPLS
jgi:alpha-tubulin suppressor-like RCC1 family protein